MRERDDDLMSYETAREQVLPPDVSIVSFPPHRKAHIAPSFGAATSCSSVCRARNGTTRLLATPLPLDDDPMVAGSHPWTCESSSCVIFQLLAHTSVHMSRLQRRRNTMCCSIPTSRT